MIIYASNKAKFHDDIMTNAIEDKIHLLMKMKSRGVGPSEITSWKNSLLYLNNVLQDDGIPPGAGVSIEYHIPNSGQRIDFILSGKTHEKRECLLVIELKQWSTARATGKASIVATAFRGSISETTHPSYQAWSYARQLIDFNAVVQDEGVEIKPCAYLHNYTPDGIIDGPVYPDDIKRAPVFLKPDAMKLREFIKKWVKYPDDEDVLYRIDNGDIRPSKGLADHLASLLKGNEEFVLIDEQKLAFETALELCRTPGKHVMIVDGGPGTGKSVVAINLLVALIQRKKNCRYISKNAAPRTVYEAKLSGDFKKSVISNLFGGSGSFTEAKANTFDVLIVDEAHRLNEKSGLFSNLGENQVKEVILAAKTSIFFVDESQRVTIKDIGTKTMIRAWAAKAGANVIETNLPSQFRCNGSDGYLSWIDNTLCIRQTQNADLEGVDYDFRVFNSPSEMYNEIIRLNKSHNKARVVAGYCWDWLSKRKLEEELFDIVIPRFNFKRKWNLGKDGGLWIMAQNSVEEVGCIHTCQGLELEYVGVIIGPDLLVRDGKMITDFRARSKMDQSLKGIKAIAKKDSAHADLLADVIIKNTYRTLMTRGMKGCFVFSTDPETNHYFASFVESKSDQSCFANLKVATRTRNYEP